jgi:hypothetical protein
VGLGVRESCELGGGGEVHLCGVCKRSKLQWSVNGKKLVYMFEYCDSLSHSFNKSLPFCENMLCVKGKLVDA